MLQPQLGIVLTMSKCTSIVIFLGVLLQPHRFFAFSPFCHFYNNINFTGKSVSVRAQDIGNGGKNLAVVQMERHVSVPVGCNEKSGAASKVVRLFRKFPLEPRVPFAFQPVEPEILAKWKAPLVHRKGKIFLLLCKEKATTDLDKCVASASASRPF